MTTTNDMTRLPRAYAVPLFLVLTAAGLAGNGFKYPLFLDVDFLFGSIFALLALQFLGLGRGILAAFLISCVTAYQHWDHAYGIITMTAEVAAVGWLYRRRDMGMIVADALYWCLIGMPLTYLLFHHALHVPLNGVAIVAIKQTVNGIGNTLLARLIFTVWGAAGRWGRVSLRELAFNLMALFVLGPSLIILILSAKSASIDTEMTIRSQLEQTNTNASQRLRVWFENRLPAIAYLAELAAILPPATMQDHLDRLRAADRNFLRLGLMDANSFAIAYSPAVDDLGMKTIGLSFADRPYLNELRQRLKPMISEVMMGRVGQPVPIASILAPVLANGSFQGYVGGVLDLKHLQDYLALAIDGKGMQYTLLDQNNNVVLTNHADQRIMAPFSHGGEELRRLDSGLSQHLPILPPHVSSTERWRKSFYVLESGLGDLSGWKLILEQPVEPFQNELDRKYADRLFEIFGILLVALALAQLLSRTVHQSLELLQRVSSDLPKKIGLGEKVDWPESGIQEANHMIANFKEVSQALDKKFGEIRQMNISLEQRVEERTQELRESEERYRELFEAESDTIFLVDKESGRILEANRAAADLYGYPQEELLTMTGTQLSAEPEETRRVIQEAEPVPGQILSIPLRFHRKKDGTVFPVEITGRFFMHKGRLVHLAAIRDITKRQRNEQALRESEERFRALFQHIPAVAVQGYGLDGTTHYWNDASERIYGYTAQEAIGLNLLDLIIPAEMRLEVREAIDRMAASGQPTPPGELSLMRKNGSRVAVYSSHAIVQRPGSEPEFFCLDVDLTELKQAEVAMRKSLAQFSALVDNMQHGVLLEDASGTVAYVNRAFRDLFHIGEPAAIIGLDCVSVAEEAKALFADPDAFIAGIDRLLQADEVVIGEELRLRDGRTFIRDYIPIMDGKTPSATDRLWVYRDISERKQAEEQILRALKEKEVLLQEVHHRVKNNMQVVHSLLNLQMRGITDPMIRTLFQETQNRVNAMALIHEKLYRTADLSSIDFKEYLQSLVQGIGNTYNRPEVKVSVEMAEPIALDVHTGIPCGLIVNELVSNSLKHAFPGGRPGTIRVGLQRQDERYVLSVTDNGIGLPDGLDINNSSSLGLQLVTVLSGQLHGAIQLTKTAGTAFSLAFPAPRS